MPSKKYMAGIPFTYRQIMGSVTVLLGPLDVASAHILRDEGSHGLHQSAGNQHGEVDDLAGHAVAGRGFQSQAVDEGAQGKEGNLCQSFL